MAKQVDVRNLGELGFHLQEIVTRLASNQDLIRYLYYTDKDPLNATKANLDIKNVFDSHIKIVPVVNIPEEDHSILSILVAKANPISSNTDFLDLYITVEIFVPTTQWILKSENLRPFLIIGEISKSLNRKSISGLGKLELLEFSANFFTEEMGSYKMYFRITQYN